MTNEQPVVLLEHAQKSFGGTPVLKDISLKVQPGEVVAVIGPSGGGKSTLLRCMTLLETLDAGRLAYGDLVVAESDGAGAAAYAPKAVLKEAKTRFGLVFQNFNLFPHYSVLKNITDAPLHVQKRPKDEVLAAARGLLAKMGLAGKEDMVPCELSGGQQRRVAFAGVLAMEPRILVLDEPVAGLDPVAREEFLDLIAQLHGSGLTVVMVSHSMDDLARLSDRVLVLNEGRQFAFGSPTEVFAHGDELRAIGLDVPAPQKLADELRVAGVELPSKLYDVKALADELAGAYRAAVEASEAPHA